MQVGEQVKKEILSQVGGLISDYMSDLDKAYINAGDDALSVTFTTGLKPMKSEDGIQLTTKISFVMEKVMDMTKGFCSKQMRIDEAPQKDMGNRMKPYLGRLDPRHLQDIRTRTCLKGYGPHCTLRHPCWACPAEQ